LTGELAGIATASGSRREYHAATNATAAASPNTAFAPKRAAIGSATAGAIAVIARLAPP